MNAEKKGYLELILYSLLAGIVGVFVKLVQKLDINSIVFIRALIASVFILLVVLFRKKLKELTIVSPLQTLLVGLFQGLSIFLFFSSILNTSVSNALFLVYTAPIFSIILAKFFLKEQIEREAVVGMVVTLIGIIFVLDPRNFSYNPGQTFGNFMGLASGFFYSAMALTAKPIMKKKSGYYVAFWQYAVISLMFVFFLKIDSTTVLMENWWKLLIIGILCTGIAFILFMEGVRNVKAQKIFIVTALEPLVGTIASLLILKEVPSFMTIIGALFILFGVYRITFRKTASNTSQQDRI
jgi:drug/metabolite transporter (DMT)-like permease